ncbi:hypothetical protein B0O80DRAFT_490784 [Mortierella sp. GBAus27b]|nr:hypothetical protein BGX31_007777 [Mortierella sp. GBA43]KAI8347052.1 hypothetical protein B0O80DRAFT_490784 [Mortierella sp. GBAus27b]
MPKRTSRPTGDQARLPHKSKSRRTGDGGADTDISTSWGDVEVNAEELLKLRLTHAIFSRRPLKHEIHSVEYLISLRSSATPTPKTEEYLAYLHQVHPAATMNSIARAWNKMSQYFGHSKDSDYSSIESLIDVPSLIAGFKEAPEIPVSGSHTAGTMPPSPLPKASKSTSRSSRASPRLGSSSISHSSSSGSGSSHPTAAQILTMKGLFEENFNGFSGDAWSLPSGAILDECLRKSIESLSYESALHSFVIEDVDAMVQLFEHSTDREEVKRVMVTREGEGLPVLSPAELNFLEQYEMAPDQLDEFLATRGWRNVGDTLEVKPSDEFQRVAHNCITHVLRVYQESDLAFPKDPSEAWFNSHLWGFLRLALSQRRMLEYKTGEVTSDASSNRHNKRRTWDSRQYTGHKVDGMVVVSARSLEICHVEAAKKDGANTTKCLDDTKKLFKLMKDAHDMIREKGTRSIRDQLVTFGLRISGPTISVFTLRQRPGRFYQAAEEETISFPQIWLDDDTGSIIAVISRILMLRKAIIAMTTSVITWTSLAINSQSLGGHVDWIVPTMTSPQFLPTTPAIPDKDISGLDL